MCMTHIRWRRTNKTEHLTWAMNTTNCRRRKKAIKNVCQVQTIKLRQYNDDLSTTKLTITTTTTTTTKMFMKTMMVNYDDYISLCINSNQIPTIFTKCSIEARCTITSSSNTKSTVKAFCHIITVTYWIWSERVHVSMRTTLFYKVLSIGSIF